ncbi:glycosyltransferase family 61 protein [Peribacillus deserti]|uniref:glycosyltransferase family 61 protein n=1 Tax=Peribacillus deserti TaxID=673318 RepID=UPI0015E13353|nr:glycosyltransferase family 61 protein [Peribacillus deserti]
MSDRLPPENIYKNLKHWNTHNGSANDTLYKIHPSISYSKTYKKPIKHRGCRYPNRVKGGYLTVIPNGRIWGRNGAIITPDNKLIWEVSSEFVKTPWEHSIFKQETLPPVTEYYDLAADLTHRLSHNYYHWMFEVIPRFHLIETCFTHIDKFIVTLPEKILPFQEETLAAIGIPLPHLVKTHDQFHIKAEKLVVPSQPSMATKWASNYLRAKFLSENNIDNTNKNRIYIRRTHYRRVLNEEELITVLKEYGFIPVELETMSVSDQVNLFSGAECIIAPHGAGLTNIVFCDPGTKIIEIFPPAYVRAYYSIISSFGNLDYHYIIGTPGGRDDICDEILLNNDWNGYENVTVNINTFEKALLKAGIDKG